VGAACAVAQPALSLARVSAEPASDSLPHSPAKAGPVRLSANENPYGPSAKALWAMNDASSLACRYPDEYAEPLIDSLAGSNGVNRDQIHLGDGSGEILKICAETFTGPKTDGNARALVAADPTFEAILHHASANGAEVIKVPLTDRFSHDLEKMQPANAGLVYVCNPNNPTATITPKNELREFIAKAPPQMMILVDEAYFHYADSPEYESVIPLIKDHPNLIVARTFSKIYGMAGLRCGYCVAQHATIERMRPYQMWDSVNIMALTAAHASVNDSGQVTTGRRLNSEAKSYVTSALNGLGYKLLPSQANFVMIDLKRPVLPLIQALKQHNVQVGRLFPAMPNHMRLTIGKKSEMEVFLSAFRKVAA
jgi:histidinol-phosphate aminotransferase